MKRVILFVVAVASLIVQSAVAGVPGCADTTRNDLDVALSLPGSAANQPTLAQVCSAPRRT